MTMEEKPMENGLRLMAGLPPIESKQVNSLLQWHWVVSSCGRTITLH